MIKVLVAEDSATTRALLVEMLRADPEIEIVGEATGGDEAVSMTKRLRPDVVTMDIHMPGVNGFEATKQIMIDAPTPIVIVSAIADAQNVAVSMQALRAGALSVFQTPPGPLSPAFDEARRQLVSTVKAMAKVKVVRRWPSTVPPAAPREIDASAAPSPACSVIAIAASTGGPAALHQILSDLPAAVTVPMLVVQHIAGGFVEGLTGWLNGASDRAVRIARQGERLAPRTVYFPPDDRHLVLSAGGLLETTSAPAVGGFRPSATRLFESIAAHGTSAVAVILTGMGSDGVDGLRAVRNTGGRVIAQDEATSVVFGMPGSAIAAGLVNETLALPLIAHRLARLAGNAREWRREP